MKLEIKEFETGIYLYMNDYNFCKLNHNWEIKMCKRLIKLKQLFCKHKWKNDYIGFEYPPNKEGEFPHHVYYKGKKCIKCGKMIFEENFLKTEIEK